MLAWLEMGDHLKAFVVKKIRDEDAAKDLVQEVFIKVHSKLHTLDDPQKINAWIFQITRNSINDYFRARKKNSFSPMPDEMIAPVFSENETNQLSKCMLPMINLLPDKYKEALTLSEIEGVSQKELARQLDLSYSGTKSRVQRGRTKLKELFLECCVVSTDKYGNVIEFKKKKCVDGCD